MVDHGPDIFAGKHDDDQHVAKDDRARRTNTSICPLKPAHFEKLPGQPMGTIIDKFSVSRKHSRAGNSRGD
jgi:hypothetical protein